VSVLYIGSLTTRCCFIATIRRRCAPLYSTSLFPQCYQNQASRFARGLPFLFFHSVSIIPVNPNYPLSFSPKNLRPLHSYRFSFVLILHYSSSHLYTCFIPCVSSLRASGVAPKCLTIAVPRSLDPSAFYYQPHYLRGACHLLRNASTTPPGWTVSYTIFYCAFTTGHNYY